MHLNFIISTYKKFSLAAIVLMVWRRCFILWGRDKTLLKGSEGTNQKIAGRTSQEIWKALQWIDLNSYMDQIRQVLFGVFRKADDSQLLNYLSLTKHLSDIAYLFPSSVYKSSWFIITWYFWNMFADTKIHIYHLLWPNPTVRSDIC